MKCVYAFLLRPKSDAVYEERLVVAHNHGESGYYGVFNPPESQFPMHNISPDIIMTKTDTRGPGTFTKLYCSTNNDVNNILTQVVDGLDSANPRLYPEFNTIEYATNVCLGQIKSIAKKHLTSKPTPIGMTRINEGKCSDSSIVYLATRGYISLKDTYNTEQSSISSSKSTVTVVTDCTVPMRNVIYDGYFFPGQITKPRKRALGWFQGDLHVFELDQQRKFWNIKTSIISEDQNGKLIVKFLLTYMEDFVRLQEQLKSPGPPNRHSIVFAYPINYLMLRRDQFYRSLRSFIFPPFLSEDQTNFLGLTKFYNM